MKLDFPKLEQKILKFWKKEKIFEKSIKARAKKRDFVFYEGPPTANGKPGIHHLEARVFKDIICRYKTMRGFRVLRKAGWDTHGLPVELEVEKKLGLKNKKDIEKFGIAKFNKKCKESVWQYKSDWEDLTEKIGYWLDMKDPYITYESNYIETVWWIIKRIFENGLLYQDYKVVPYCPRCGTSLSSHEVARGYKTIKENAVTVKFELVDEPGTYILAWTTTPWTLPANVALAVNPEIDYLKFSLKNYPGISDGNYITSKKDFEDYKEEIGKNKFRYGAIVKIIDKFKGKDLVGKEYKPLYPFDAPYKVIAGGFVSIEEGTGVVHIAPAFGEDDMNVIKMLNVKCQTLNEPEFPILLTVNEEGKFKKEVKKWAGMFVKDADPLIIEDLKKRGLLFGEELYEHDYPFCWRCKTPLLYYAKKSWFIRMTEVKRRLIKNNQKINWIPSYLKKGRFGQWLKDLKDWAVSRERYWGTPLPVWLCQTVNSQQPTVKSQKSCDNIVVIGSIRELEKLSGKKISELHRPYIDEITFKCDKCGGLMKRVPEVIDCWFDSGSMPFAQYHYPFKDKDLIDKKNQFPADYICEAVDQTRGWFYTLLAISTLLGFGPSYKTVISLGHVLDKQGEKMSKSKGNIVDPWYIIGKYGADASRWYFYTVNQPGDSKLFSERDVEKSLKKFILTFWNCFIFYNTYAKLRKTPQQNINVNPRNYQRKSATLLDKWIISRLNGLVEKVTQKMDKYDIVFAARDIENFVIDDLSLWYIRRSRKRFQKPRNAQELKEVAKTLALVLETLSKLSAPFTPFIAENIYKNVSSFKCRLAQQVSKKMSVHLEDWPKANKNIIDKGLETKMEQARKIVAMTLNQRAEAGIKIRQPLSSLKIKDLRFKIKGDKELLELIKDEVNVREVVFGPKIKGDVELDTEITPELKEKGVLREVIRQIQQMRKTAGYKPKDKIMVRYEGTEFLNKILNRNKNFVLREMKVEDFCQKDGALYRTVQGGADQVFDIEKEIKIEGQKLWLAIKKI